MKLTVHLYAEPASPSLDLGELTRYLKSLLPIETEARDSFFSHFPIKENEVDPLALAFARAKIRNPLRQEELTPLPGEIEYERRRLTSLPSAFGLAYQGERVQVLFRNRLPQEERGLGHLHIIFTRQLLATWESSRYHLRVAIFGFPCLLSTTGLVEAPAKPREFYLLKQQYFSLGIEDATAQLEGQFQERMLKIDDPQTTEVMKGYVMQSLFYHLTGGAFCEEANCRLFNAHWQEEMIAAQLKGEEFCPAHKGKLEEWRNGKGELATFVAGTKAPSP